MLSLKRTIAYLETGSTVRDLLGSMRAIEAELDAFLGTSQFPRCLVEPNRWGEQGWFVRTSLPGIDYRQQADVPDRPSEEEDRELRDHLLKVLRAWEREVELKESPPLKSIPEAKKAIAELFRFARTVFNRFRLIESFRVETFEFTTLSTGSPRSSGRSTKKKRSQESEDLERSKRKRVEELKQRGLSISKELIFLEKDREILQTRFRSVSEILSLVCRELGDAPGGNRTAILDLASVAENVSIWGDSVRRLCDESFLQRIPLAIPFDDLTRRAFEQIEIFPLSEELETKLRKRLLDEEAVAKEKLVERADLWGLSSPKAVDPVRAKPNRVQTPEEAENEAKLIAFLNEYESWQARKKADTGRKRWAPRDWLKDRKGWLQSAKILFESHCREIDGTEEEVLLLTLGRARKARVRRNKREQSKD